MLFERMQITIDPDIKQLFPELCLATFSCSIHNTLYNNFLWQLIQNEVKEIQNSHTDFSQIKANNRIRANREAYKKLGKDPNRYRPSAESLMRRIIKGIDLYQVNTVVDLINLVSLHSGFSIGAFNLNAITGDLYYTRGNQNDQYEGIGRGPLNIENLPVLKDEKGGIGTPTSDEVRTAIRPQTNQLLVNINVYTGYEDVKNTLECTIQLCEQFIQAKDIDIKIVN
jgi:DNA/RNA-binding domain of Phe-tRNA-synthetase-like protein